jgi:formate hydrogenlyase subunit 6/NADH:ubiquinone oxidoreductase subunit I
MAAAMSNKKMIFPGAMIEFVLRSLFKKPATVLYPFEEMKMPERFRGRLTFDPAKCIGCLLCVRDCPTEAIQIKKIGEKKFEAEIDLGKCIYCAQCVDVCLKKALAITPEFELAQADRDKLKIVFDVEPEKKPAEPS